MKERVQELCTIPSLEEISSLMIKGNRQLTISAFKNYSQLMMRGCSNLCPKLREWANGAIAKVGTLLQISKFIPRKKRCHIISKKWKCKSENANNNRKNSNYSDKKIAELESAPNSPNGNQPNTTTTQNKNTTLINHWLSWLGETQRRRVS